MAPQHKRPDVATLHFPQGDSQGALLDRGNALARTYVGKDATYPERLFKAYKTHCFKSMGIIETAYDESARLFRHKRLRITYPHEWTPTMLKQAVLFHLDLLIELDAVGWTLKDALPENILFEDGRPVFVDFFSLVTDDDLSKESWLPRHPLGPRYSVLHTMFIPYMLLPLLCYASRNYTLGKQMLATAFCNNAESASPYALFPLKPRLQTLTKAKLKLILNRSVDPNIFIHARIADILLARTISWRDTVVQLRSFIIGLTVTEGGSGYTSYYADKKENFPLADTRGWQEKQRAYASCIQQYRPVSLLELGANTGWFPQLAAMHGAKVIASDIDVACAEHLHHVATLRREHITSLWMSFDEFTAQAFSLDAQGKRHTHPLHMPATARLNCEAVSCLGLFHHLTLGMGKSFADVFAVLARLAERVLILEFITLDDPLIRQNPDFFPCLDQWNEQTYAFERVLDAASGCFTLRNRLTSTPADTRSILVFEKS
ncbi:hypothetical protein PCS_00713 [Desulfocurvibacter africanus PCS]|uniref:Methyltransferase domain containing protein n=1 Tax=Desulfocurvibacter africanus PCS TaxID=1262666 RepID=M5PWQ6_DESAF|nr:hypothetical protein PCS_00713 [Desulfocurvibacter africanus PCS]